MTNVYHIGIDEDEVLSSLFFGGEGFPSREEAEAHLETYDDIAKSHFRVYHVVIEPVSDMDRVEAILRGES